MLSFFIYHIITFEMYLCLTSEVGIMTFPQRASQLSQSYLSNIPFVPQIFKITYSVGLFILLLIVILLKFYCYSKSYVLILMENIVLTLIFYSF